MTQETLSVPEIHCDHCKHSIEGAVAAITGVTSVAVSVEDRTVAVDYEPPADRAAIVTAIDEQGYEVATF